MLTFKCPQCGENNKLLSVMWLNLRDRSGRRCSNCGVKLEIENAALIGILIGLLGGGLVTSLKEFGIRSFPVQLAVTVLVMWLAALLLVTLIARWKVTPEIAIDSPELRKWSRVFNISVTAGLVAIVMTNILIAVAIKRIQVLAASADSLAAMELADQTINVLLTLPLIGFGAVLVTLVVDIYASMKCKKIRLSLSNEVIAKDGDGT